MANSNNDVFWSPAYENEFQDALLQSINPARSNNQQNIETATYAALQDGMQNSDNIQHTFIPYDHEDQTQTAIDAFSNVPENLFGAGEQENFFDFNSLDNTFGHQNTHNGQDEVLSYLSQNMLLDSTTDVANSLVAALDETTTYDGVPLEKMDPFRTKESQPEVQQTLLTPRTTPNQEHLDMGFDQHTWVHQYPQIPENPFVFQAQIENAPDTIVGQFSEQPAVHQQQLPTLEQVEEEMQSLVQRYQELSAIREQVRAHNLQQMQEQQQVQQIQDQHLLQQQHQVQRQVPHQQVPQIQRQVLQQVRQQPSQTIAQPVQSQELPDRQARSKMSSHQLQKLLETFKGTKEDRRTLQLQISQRKTREKKALRQSPGSAAQ